MRNEVNDRLVSRSDVGTVHSVSDAMKITSVASLLLHTVRLKQAFDFDFKSNFASKH